MRSLETRVTSFIESFGGEVVAKLLKKGGDLPKNADFLLFDRTVVAELKCLEKDYFSAHDVERKLTALVNGWIRSGILRDDQIQNGKFSVNDLSEICALQTLEVFAKPIREAITHANNQIKETKRHFDLPTARGLILIANDGNRSLNPDLVMHILGRLLRARFSALDSFVYFAPDMQITVPDLNSRLVYGSPDQLEQKRQELIPSNCRNLVTGG